MCLVLFDFVVMEVGVMIVVDVLVQFDCVFFQVGVVIDVVNVVCINIVQGVGQMCCFIDLGLVDCVVVQCIVGYVCVWRFLFLFFVVGEEEQFVFDQWIVQCYVVGVFVVKVVEFVIGWVFVELIVVVV